MDAGGPSAEPLADGKIEPKDWKGYKTVYQARQKLEYLNRAIDGEHAAYVTRVGSHQLFVYQRSAVMRVTQENNSKPTQLG